MKIKVESILKTITVIVTTLAICCVITLCYKIANGLIDLRHNHSNGYSYTFDKDDYYLYILDDYENSVDFEFRKVDKEYVDFFKDNSWETTFNNGFNYFYKFEVFNYNTVHKGYGNTNYVYVIYDENKDEYYTLELEEDYPIRNFMNVFENVIVEF